MERVDSTARFTEDRWLHTEGGGGKTRAMQGGDIFEKAGVNVSAVTSRLTEKLAVRFAVAPQPIFATGISLVLHPLSPMIPTVHMNLRYLELENGDAWFGGGTDLTPYYLIEEDARYFHRTLKNACDKHNPDFYPRFKKACDEYFYLPHRGEARGVGGIFFDYQREKPETFFAFIQEMGHVFLYAYLPIAEQRKNDGWTEAEKRWQVLRRGRYVEFNLLHDRGTLFGLETGGRTESILMSLPPLAGWQYNLEPLANSREARLLEVLRQPREWA